MQKQTKPFTKLYKKKTKNYQNAYKNTNISYTRYADDWFIFIHGNRQLIYNKIQTWLQQYLKLTLSSEKTLITKYNVCIKSIKTVDTDAAKAKALALAPF